MFLLEIWVHINISSLIFYTKCYHVMPIDVSIIRLAIISAANVLFVTISVTSTAYTESRYKHRFIAHAKIILFNTSQEASC